mmetsp:Transcript_106944/g.190119  ORF Transcript_106944/g.190119 Transcript_106944/m.190119 type:complete len:260 (+) Transcript_106944:140-919(+)
MKSSHPSHAPTMPMKTSLLPVSSETTFFVSSTSMASGAGGFCSRSTAAAAASALAERSCAKTCSMRCLLRPASRSVTATLAASSSARRASTVSSAAKSVLLAVSSRSCSTSFKAPQPRASDVRSFNSSPASSNVCWRLPAKVPRTSFNSASTMESNSPRSDGCSFKRATTASKRAFSARAVFSISSTSVGSSRSSPASKDFTRAIAASAEAFCSAALLWFSVATCRDMAACSSSVTATKTLAFCSSSAAALAAASAEAI